MKFKEIEKEPEFNLNLSLEEAISLWKIVSSAYDNGNEKAGIFVDALHDFAERSNEYAKFLNSNS